MRLLLQPLPLLLAALTMAWVAFDLLRYRHDREITRRFRAGHLLNCGYDLRAQPNFRCPECGKF